MKLPIFSKLITLILLVSCVAGLQADFVNLSIWERTTTTGEKQHLVCLGDQHNLNSQADKPSDDLINWLEQRNNPNDMILIEDIFNCAYVINQARAYLKEHIDGWDDSCLQNIQSNYHEEAICVPVTALSKVGQKVSNKKHIKYLNVDSRICSGGFFMLLSDLSKDWVKFLQEDVDDFIVKKIVQEIKNYNDCALLNAYYQKCVSPLLRILKIGGSLSYIGIMRILEQCQEEIWTFLSHPSSNYYEYFEIPFSFNKMSAPLYYFMLLCELMDVRLLHHIYQEQLQKDQANVVVVCAGFAHIWNIETKLGKLGYTPIYKDGLSSIDNIKKGVTLTQRLKDSLNKIPVYSAQHAQIKRRMQHMFLDFDTDMTYPPAKQQAKL